MREGWYEGEYFILFAEDEASLASDQYGIAGALPGFQIVGLRGWDDFIVRDQSGGIFTVPAVPCDAKYLRAFPRPPAASQLAEDARAAGKIKWYLKPLVFGGDAGIGENLTWVTHDQHAQLVRWWNNEYRVRVAKVGSG